MCNGTDWRKRVAATGNLLNNLFFFLGLFDGTSVQTLLDRKFSVNLLYHHAAQGTLSCTYGTFEDICIF